MNLCRNLINDDLFIKVGSKLTDYTHEPFPSRSGLQKVTFTFTWRVIIFWPSFAHHRFSALYRNWVYSLTRWSCVTPRFQASVSDSINLRLIVCCLLTLQGEFTPEILNRIHLLRLGGQGQLLASWCCSRTSTWLPVWHDDVVHCHPSNRTDSGIKLFW